MTIEFIDTQEQQHVETEAAATAATDTVELPPRRGRARLWLAALGFVLAAAIVVVGVHGPDVHAHRLQMTASARRLRSDYSHVLRVAPADLAAKMPDQYKKKHDNGKGDSASKKAQRNRTSGDGGRQ